MNSLTQLLVSLLQRPISARDRQRARLHLMDWFACARHACDKPEGQRWIRAIGDAGGAKPQKPPGKPGWTVAGLPVDSASALLLNGALGNVGEMDDVHRSSVLHPGPVVVPAAIAVAAQGDATLDELLDAVIRGYETTIRIGRGLGPAHYRYHHSTATAGALGAASAAASLLRLDADAWVWALGNAGSVTGGLWQLRNETVDTKQWHNAHAAWTGVQAARLSAAGLRGPQAILEGPQGLLTALSDGGLPDQVTDDPDGEWLLHDCSFKPWPACRHAHPVIDAALQLRSQVDVESIADIHIESYGDALLFCDRPSPATATDAQFSLQYCVAVALLGGSPTLADFAPQAWERKAHRRIMERVSVAENSDITGRYPQHFGAQLKIADRDGEKVCTVEDTLGDPARPLSEDQHLDKLAMLLEAADRARLQDRVEHFRNLPGQVDVPAALSVLEDMCQ